MKTLKFVKFTDDNCFICETMENERFILAAQNCEYKKGIVRITDSDFYSVSVIETGDIKSLVEYPNEERALIDNENVLHGEFIRIHSNHLDSNFNIEIDVAEIIICQILDAPAQFSELDWNENIT